MYTASDTSIGNSDIDVVVSNTGGLTLTGVRDLVTSHEWIQTPGMLFEYAVDDGAPYNSADGTTIDTWTPRTGGLSVTAHADQVPLAFGLEFDAAADSPSVVMSTTVTNTGTGTVSVRLVHPKIHSFASPGTSADFMGCIPQETAGVAHLDAVSYLGMGLDLDLGLPTAMNVLEVACLWDDAGGGGLYFADLDGDTNLGVPPLQFVISAGEISAFYTMSLQPGEQRTLPRLAIGVNHAGDWHQGVQYFVDRHPTRTYVDTPAWLREAGAIYSPTAGGAGAAYLYQQPQTTIDQRITDFTQLPQLLAEAQDLGTNVLYLSDFWEGLDPDPQGFPPYYDKGDYIPNTALGGAEALTAGIEAVHEADGRVLAYVESFIVYQYSDLGGEIGEAWGGRDAAGDLDQTYLYYYTMVAPFAPWQDQLVDICRRLVGEYGFDGIFLDSVGWQMNRRLGTAQEGVFYGSQEWSDGVVRLVNRVRTAVREVKADAVVLTESVSGPVARQIDGGSSADVAWLWDLNAQQIAASPIRYTTASVNAFNNGRICTLDGQCTDEGVTPYSTTPASHRNELNQVFAAGQCLALSYLEPLVAPDAQAYAASLLAARRTYLDAFVYGRQTYMPRSATDRVTAYVFEGTDHQVMTLVNASDTAFTTALALEAGEADTTWSDELTGETFTASGTTLIAPTDAGVLRILVRQGPFTGQGAPVPPVTPTLVQLLSADFDDGQFLDHWTVFDGSWSVADGALQADDPTQGGTVLFTDRTGGDFTYTADLTVLSGGEAGMSIRQSDDGTQGYDIILSLLDGGVKLAARPYQVLGFTPMPIVLGRTYRVQVSAVGDSFTVTIDGTEQLAVTDATYASGRLGFTNFDSTARFDNATAETS